MRTSFFLTAALATLGTQAKDSSSSSEIIGYFSPSWDAGLLQYGGWTSTAASLVAYKSGTATYHVGCLKDAPKTDCNYPSSWTIVQGPETVSLDGKYIASTSDKTSSYEMTVSQSYHCSLKASTESASCTMSVSMSGSVDGAKVESSTSSKATYTTAPISASYYQLTVTAGLESITTETATTTKSTGGAAGHAGAMITAAPMVAAALAALL
ncbi:hypothetical protein DTO013E5_766 [Penicillium roqueforti]|uniref:Genomic scaffold, ProqFM164S02 n=1 Tax=Penicillium roqueforti (strain FM164) TaxID=1365484 RepID=W6Q5W4_PENRF|nr:uncharacterized protein LCP9604111_1133 [Penicillium roqueforti]CDM31371.1 unnamed protein product [Penicillium roqueforti FM164]KAF9253607.1 hypothetical protein LCP9604111_1133 [Penicillium roqueforti]KAI1839123.1 hypothetical protein CBS147337_848 [Penicillium roqueforti]KAI2686364.1 hypothetical protein CBS147355_1851 [Penicillium roqueforti]KAI2691587.1 hypothetical protein LCP963914a_1788 [Penicillium roqueforti]